MDFTREPLIETVITPKEGFRLLIRSIVPSSQEEYSVVAVEVVSFGRCYFFRSLEKPQAFLLPMTKYEVVEAREVRTILKKASPEKSIKIGGTKKMDLIKEGDSLDEGKRRDKKRLRKKHPKEESEKPAKKEGLSPVLKEGSEEGVFPPKLSLLPPPTSLISDQINRYKHYLLQKETDSSENESLLSEEKEEPLVDVEESMSLDHKIASEEKSIQEMDEQASASPEEAP